MMTIYQSGCVICGKPLIYGQAQQLECTYCHTVSLTEVQCEKGHYLCAR